MSWAARIWQAAAWTRTRRRPWSCTSRRRRWAAPPLRTISACAMPTGTASRPMNPQPSSGSKRPLRPVLPSACMPPARGMPPAPASRPTKSRLSPGWRSTPRAATLFGQSRCRCSWLS